MTSIRLLDQVLHTEPGHPNPGISRPTRFPIMIRLNSLDDPNPSIIGDFCTTKQEIQRKKDREEDYFGLRLLIADREKHHSFFGLEITMHYHNRDNRYLDAKAILYINQENLNEKQPRISITSFMEVIPEVQEHYRTIFNFTEDDPTWMAITQNGVFKLGAFRYDPSKRDNVVKRVGFNLFTDGNYGALTPKLQEFRDFFSRPQHVHFILDDGDILDITKVNIKIRSVGRDSRNSPIRKYFGPSKRHVEELSANYGQLLDPDNRPNVRLPPQQTFQWFSEWEAILGYGAKYEHEIEAEAHATIQTFSCHLLQVDGAGINRFIGLVNWQSSDDNLRPRPQEKLKVYLGCHNYEHDDWVGTVMEPLPYASIDQICIVVDRPRDPNNRDKFRAFDPEIRPHTYLKDLDCQPAEVPNVISSKGSINCSFRVIVSDSTIKRLWKTIAALHERSKGKTSVRDPNSKAKKPTIDLQWYPILKKLLIALDPSALPKTDLFTLFKDPTQARSDIIQGMNERQIEVVDACREAPGRVVIAEGPPGAGKTYTAIQIAVRIAQEGGKVLLVSGMNQITTNLYEKALGAIVKAQEKLPMDKRRQIVVIRCHSIPTEHSILWRDAHNHRLRTSSRQSTINEEMREDLQSIEIAQRIVEIVDNFHRQEYAGIADKRVRVLEGSLGFSMCAISGLIKRPDGSFYPFALPLMFETFVNAYNRYRRDEYFTADETKDMMDSMNALREYTLSKASIVSTTLSNASERKVHNNFFPSFAVIEEATKSTELDCLILLTFYDTVKVFLLIGDSQQLRPLVKFIAHNPLGPQMRQSLHTRLLLAGHKAVFLNHQQRYCQEIMDIINPIFYEDALQIGHMDQSSVEFYQNIFQAEYGIRNNSVFLNVPNTRILKSDANPSSSNPREALAVIEAIKACLERGVSARSIGILTPFQSQYETLLKGIEALGRNMSLPLSQDILCAKFDGMSGDERDVLIISLVITKSLGFLSDGFRINTGISRARYGLIIVGDKNQILKIHKIHLSKLGKVLANFDKRTYRISIPEVPSYLTGLIRPEAADQLESGIMPPEDNEKVEDEIDDDVVPFLPSTHSAYQRALNMQRTQLKEQIQAKEREEEELKEI